MTIRKLYEKLSNLYPENLRCEWDNDGIMCCENLDKEVIKILVALDVTNATIDFAIDNKFDLIVSHHPLVFSSQKSLTPDKFTQAKLIKLIKNNVSVFSFHTRLDAANGGVNDVLCEKIKLQNVQVDEVEPIGRIGTLANELTLDSFAKSIKEALDTPLVLFNGNKPVKNVYLVGGDGKDLISRAISMGADTLLTGRASYNTMIDATDMGLNIVEAGHFFTENPVCEKIKSDILSIDNSFIVETYNSFSIKLVK